MRLNQELADKHSGGVRNRDAYRQATAQLRKDQPAYEKYQQAERAAEQGEYSKALSLAEQAIEHQPRENLFWELKGRLLDRKSTRLNSSHVAISYAVFCLKKKKKNLHKR